MNPIHQDPHDLKWYFTTEAWVPKHGPFASEQEGRAAFDQYVIALCRELGVEVQFNEP
jgi:hypothetical protein